MVLHPMSDSSYTYILTFGKYKGKTLKQVLDKDPVYITWLNDNVSNMPRIKETIVQEAHRRGQEEKVPYDNMETGRACDKRD